MLRTDSESGWLMIDEKSFCSRHEDELGEMVMVQAVTTAGTVIFPGLSA